MTSADVFLRKNPAATFYDDCSKKLVCLINNLLEYLKALTFRNNHNKEIENLINVCPEIEIIVQTGKFVFRSSSVFAFTIPRTKTEKKVNLHTKFFFRFL